MRYHRSDVPGDEKTSLQGRNALHKDAPLMWVPTIRNEPLLPITEKTGPLNFRIVLFDDTSFSGVIVGNDDHARMVLRGTSQKPFSGSVLENPSHRAD